MRMRNRKMAPGVLKSMDMYVPRMIMFPYGAPMARKKLRKDPTQNPLKVSGRERPPLPRMECWRVSRCRWYAMGIFFSKRRFLTGSYVFT
jgi:hypothetical protein